MPVKNTSPAPVETTVETTEPTTETTVAVETTVETATDPLALLAGIVMTPDAIKSAKPTTTTKRVMRALSDYPTDKTRARRVWELGRGSIVQFDAAPGVDFEIVKKSAPVLFVRQYNGVRIDPAAQCRKDDHLAIGSANVPAPGVVAVDMSHLTHTLEVVKSAPVAATAPATIVETATAAADADLGAAESNAPAVN